MTEDEDLLAGIDLNAWQVPPPAPVDRSSLLGRALSPATAPARRPRLRWLVAGIVLANAAVATLIVILLARPQQTRTVVTVQPAGGSAIDPRVSEYLQRLEEDERQLEAKAAELRAQRDLVLELEAKVRQCEERTIEKKPAPAAACDEVSCVLNNYEGTCCLKYRRQPGLPEALDRAAISNGIASVKAKVASCRGKGIVKVHAVVSPDGVVTSASIAATPDAALGTCVKAAIEHAVFQRTQNGGSFTYPFVF